MKKEYSGVCVKVYFNPADFAEIAKDAEKAGIRRVGLQLYTQKPHGFATDKLANTDRLAKFLKYCWKYWRETESSRIEQKAQILKDEKELQERKKKMGLI